METRRATQMCRLVPLKVSRKLEAGTGATEPGPGEVWASRSSAGDREGGAAPPPASGAVKGPWRHLERARRNHTPSRLQAPITTFSKWGWTETGTEVEGLEVLVL